MTAPKKKSLFRNPLPEPRVNGKTMVVYNRRDTLWGLLSMKQGLFADFFAVIGALSYAEKHRAAGVSVNFQTDIYVEPERGENWWAYYFEPEMIVREDILRPPEIHFNRWISLYGPWAWNRSWSSVILPDYPKTRPYPINAAGEMKRIGALVSKYIRVKEPIREKVEKFRSLNMAGEFIIGIHYRGTDKKLLYPYKSPSYALFEEQIGLVSKRYKKDRFKVFIATDEIEFLEWAKDRYPDNVLFYDESPRLSASDPIATRGGAHKSREFSPYLKGETAVIDCLLLSCCNYLIKNRSSLSDISLAFNPSLEWSMVLGEDDPIYSSAPVL